MSQEQGTAYQGEHVRLAPGGRKATILCLDGFYLASAGYYDDARKKTDLQLLHQHVGAAHSQSPAVHRLMQLLNRFQRLGDAAGQFSHALGDPEVAAPAAVGGGVGSSRSSKSESIGVG